jgi:hypothetical protein
MLVKVKVGDGETSIEIDLEQIAEVKISDNGKLGYITTLGAQNSFKLKDGRKYMTTREDAQRIIDAIRQKLETNSRRKR